MPTVLADPVLLPQALTGGGTGGSTFIVTNSAGTNNGTPTGTTNFSPGLAIEDGTLSTQSDSFDNGLTVWVDDVILAAAGDTVDRTGQTITAGPNAMSGLNVSVQYHAVPTSATLRTVVFMGNPTGSPISATVKVFSNLGADAGATVEGSSSGDTTFTAADRWVVTGDSSALRPARRAEPGGPRRSRRPVTG